MPSRPEVASRAIARVIPLLLVGCSAAVGAQVTGQGRSPAVPADSTGPVRFARFQGLIFLEVGTTESEPLVTLLDTGANVSAIDPRRSAHLAADNATTIQGSTGSVPGAMVRLAGLRLGSRTVHELRVTRRSLAGLKTADGRDVDLILGMDALLGGHLTIDFVEETLSWTSGPSDAPGIASPMALDNGIPAVPATIATLNTWLRIDTGAGLFATDDIYVNIPMHLWDLLAGAFPTFRPEGELLGTGIGGEQVTLPYARVGPAHIASFRRDSIVVVGQPAQGYFAEPHAKGFVGNNFLEKLGRVTLDFVEGRLVRAGPVQ